MLQLPRVVGSYYFSPLASSILVQLSFLVIVLAESMVLVVMVVMVTLFLYLELLNLGVFTMCVGKRKNIMEREEGSSWIKEEEDVFT